MAHQKLHNSHSSNLRLFLLLILFATSKSHSPNTSIKHNEARKVLATLLRIAPRNSTFRSFLTSPSGKFSAYLVRRRNSPSSDLCFIEVKGGGLSVWKSGCALISSTKACNLVFSCAGFEVLNGDTHVWGSGPEESVQSKNLTLLDSGELLMKDSAGKNVWNTTGNTPAPACTRGLAEEAALYEVIYKEQDYEGPGLVEEDDYGSEVAEDGGMDNELNAAIYSPDQPLVEEFDGPFFSQSLRDAKEKGQQKAPVVRDDSKASKEGMLVLHGLGLIISLVSISWAVV